MATIANALKPAVKRPAPVSFSTAIRHLGGFGLLLLAVLDSSPLPTFGGPDILTAILAARHREPWYYYAALATTGSVIGAYFTFRLARRAGSAYLQKKFGERKVSKLLKYFEKWGTGALLASTAIPLPFPTSAFFAAAGVLNYPLRTFMVVVTGGRAVRYAAVALFASYYGRHFIRVIRHPDRYVGWFLLIAALLAGFILAGFWIRRRLEQAEEELVPGTRA
jgi:membrane protein YqaA with SNARE-associated domain